MMSYSMAASHAKGKCATDNIFGAAAAAAKAVQQVGKEQVVNATIGAILDDQERLVCLPTVEKVMREMPVADVISYAPIAGLPKYLEAATDLTFANHRPEAYTAAVATAGGSGVIHHTIWNYSEIGDTVLTSDWYWGAYSVLCEDALRKLDTFQLFDEQLNFNLASLEQKVKEVLSKQNQLILIINAPAHNPTGYSLTDQEWQSVLDMCKKETADMTKKIVILVDVAYLDYAGEKNECRSFMSLFSNLPKNMLAIFGFSMSKGYTMYGQRVGAMVGVSSDKDVIKEFEDINQFTSRATWSNINRGTMQVLATIHGDAALTAQVEAERESLYQLIRERAGLFIEDAKKAQLKMLPYRSGFFLSIPANNPGAACEYLHRYNIFAVPLGKGVRIAVCAVPKHKVGGMAAKVAEAVAATN